MHYLKKKGYGNIDCSTINLKLVGKNLTRFYWENSEWKVDFYQIILGRKGQNMLNTKLPGSKNSIDVTNLEFNTE